MQLNKAWEAIKHGHKFGVSAANTRILLMSCDLFPPNIAAHGAKSSLSQPISARKPNMRMLLEFINTKRQRDDVVIIFDGRSRECRKAIDENETLFTKQHTMSALWLVYEVPATNLDPRVPTREQGLSRCNTEVAYVSLPLKSRRSYVKVMARSDFNNCDETLTSSTTYAGIPMRRM